MTQPLREPISQPALEAFSDYRKQWGTDEAEQSKPSVAKVWRHWNDADTATRQAQNQGPTSRLYQNKSPRPTRRGDLGGAGGAQPSPAAVTPKGKRREIQEAPQNAPTYVKQCSRAGGRGWSLWLWQHKTPEHKVRCEYVCGGWRHPGDCQRAAAALLYARLKEATDRYAAPEWVFAVMTLDRNGYYSGQPWKDSTEAYRALGHMTEKFLKRLRRFAIRRGWPSFKSEWCQVVEAHKSGWPHVNILIHCPELALFLASEKAERTANGESDHIARLIKGELEFHAMETGWGKRSTMEQVENTGKMAGYLTDVAKHADEHLGELSKLTQVPMNAPHHFRRLRSGKGFLPPVRKNPEWTGTLVRRYFDPMSGYVAQAFSGKSQVAPERAAILHQCEAIEESEFIHELVEMQRARKSRRPDKNAFKLPPVTQWLNGARCSLPVEDEYRFSRLMESIQRATNPNAESSNGGPRSSAESIPRREVVAADVGKVEGHCACHPKTAEASCASSQGRATGSVPNAQTSLF